MSEADESGDWVAGATIEATAEGLTLFAGQSVPIDTSQLPEPPDDENVA